MNEVKKPFSRGFSGEQQGEEAPMSDLEKEIVRLVAQGYRDDEICEKLFIKEHALNDHLRSIFNKFGVSNRLELTLYAIQRHVIGQR
jgi:DNA-binding CsgD family transcriptional regulator